MRVEHSADDVVAHAGEVLHSSAADHHDRVFLEVMFFARDVARHFVAVGEAHAGDFAERRVRFFRRRGVDAHAHAAFLRTFFHGGRFDALRRHAARFAD